VCVCVCVCVCCEGGGLGLSTLWIKHDTWLMGGECMVPTLLLGGVLGTTGLSSKRILVRLIVSFSVFFWLPLIVV